jgi:hypothetical protein
MRIMEACQLRVCSSEGVGKVSGQVGSAAIASGDAPRAVSTTVGELSWHECESFGPLPQPFLKMNRCERSMEPRRRPVLARPGLVRVE